MTVHDLDLIMIYILAGLFVAVIIGHAILAYKDHKEENESEDDK